MSFFFYIEKRAKKKEKIGVHKSGTGGVGGQANFGNARMNVRAHEVASMKITLMMIMILVDNGDGEGKI